jgi:predicted nucleic acid-binding protein
VTGRPPDLPLADLDTSFWTNAHRADVAANSFDLFRILVPRAVEAEIRASQADDPAREYPYATLFRRLRDQMIDPPADAPAPIDRFGAGEAAAIPLAQSLGAHPLINERPAAEYAASLGIAVVTMPAVVVALRMRGVVGDRAARRKLELIASNTAPELIADATALLDRLARPDASETNQPEPS